MKTLNVPGNQRLSNMIMLFAIPICYLFMMILLYPYIDCFEFDTDEGINMMKALLLSKGYPLYREIWSDQPPLFTYALAVAFRLFGFDVNVARFFVLLLSALLLAGAWQFLKTIGGRTYALTGCLLTVILPYYMRLSVSSMIGLPAISFAVISLSLLANWHTGRSYMWLVLSAFTLAISVFTKAFTAFLPPDSFREPFYYLAYPRNKYGDINHPQDYFPNCDVVFRVERRLGAVTIPLTIVKRCNSRHSQLFE